MKKSLMLAALLIVGTSLAAQSSDIGSEKLNETLITTENFETTILDTAKDVTIVTQEDIQNKGATTVAQALQGVPGLTVSLMDGTDATFDLRGFGATAGQNTLVLLDGIPLNSVQGSGYDTSQIPVSMIDKIEVIPSGGNIMYGDGAIGGVINIITKAPMDKANYGSVGLEASSWGTLNGNLHYGTKVTNKLLVDAAYNGYKSHGYRSISNPNYDKDDAKNSVWLRGKYLLDDGSIDVKYRHSNTDDYYTGSLTEKQFDDNPKQSSGDAGVAKTTDDSYSAKYTTKISENLNFMVYGGYDRKEYKGNAYYPSSNYFSNIHYVTTQYYAKPQFKYTYAENSYVILGGDFKDGKSKDKLISVEDKKKKSYAGYILNKTTIGNFQFSQGFRHEKLDYKTPINSVYSSKDFNANSWELTGNYLYSDSGSVYISYNYGFRGPSIQELNWWDGDIKLQKNNSYEIGIKDMYKNTFISASVFRIDTENEIFYDSPDPNWQTQKNKNFDGKVRRVGGQISLQHYFDKLILRENLTYIQPKVKSGKYSGKEFPGVSRWNANIGATYNFTEKLLANFDLYYVSKAYVNDDFANKFGKLNSHTTADINIKYQFNEGLEVYTGIRNLFDKKYANAVFGTTQKGYYPADGRSYYAGFRYNF